MKKTKYVFVTGGVVSSLGKGITAASLGRLLKERGYSVTIQKFDPYINIDPGTMNPYEHGEVFVTNDGAETDLDLGHYERFLDENLTKYNNITTGKVYESVINNEIKAKIELVGKENNSDIVITEIGGTVGDIESTPFLEAIRQFKYDVGRGNVLYIHVTLLPYLKAAGELKTKPSQHSVKELMSLGIRPDILVCRTEHPVSLDIKRKLSMFCDIDEDAVIEAPDAKTIYEVPLIMEENGLANVACKKLGIENKKPTLKTWKEIVRKIKHPTDKIKLAVVGKYIELKDAYISINESIEHAAYELGLKAEIHYIQAEELDTKILEQFNGILIPGGFGDRGVQGKIDEIKFGMETANSTEFDKNTEFPVIDILLDQKNIENLGGTMRLGLYPCKLEKDSLAYELYQEELIYERHRHRYEFNNIYKEIIQKNGLKISGTSPDGTLAEIVELPKELHPFFIAGQFHPEFKSRPGKPHPLFLGFVKAIYKRENN